MKERKPETARPAELQEADEGLQDEIGRRRQAEKYLRQYARRLEILLQIEQAIRAARSPAEIVNATLSQIKELIPCQRVSLILIDLDAGVSTLFAMNVAGDVPAEIGWPVALPNAAHIRKLELGQPIVVPDIAALDTPGPVEEERFIKEGIRSYINLPLNAHSRLIGSLNLASTTADYFNDEHVEIAGQVALQLAVALEQARLLEETQQRLKELTVLHAIAVASAHATDENQLLDQVTDIIGQRIYTSHFGVLLLDADANILQPHSSYRGISEAAMGMKIALGKGISGAVAADGRPRRVADVTQDPQYIEATPETRSELCVPLQVADQIIGVINAESEAIDAYSEADERLLVTCAGQLAVALQRLRTQEAERRRSQEMAALLTTSQLVSASLELENVLEAIADQFELLFHADCSYIHLLQEDEETLSCVICRHQQSKPTLARPFKMGQGLPGKVAASGAARVATLEDEAGLQRTATPNGQEYLALTPLKIHGQVIGVMTVSRFRPKAPFAQLDLDLLAAFATHAAIAINNARLYHHLETALEQEQTTRAQLVHAEKLTALGQLAASVAHELSNPLQVILHALRYISNTNQLSKGSERKINLALRESHRMIDLIARLRDTYRPVDKPILQPVQLNYLVEEVRQLTETHMRHHQIQFSAELEPDLPVVPGVRDQLHQVILNLTLNAVEAMPGGGMLEVATGHDSDQAMAWLKMTDSGIGIKAEDMSHIFEPFFTRKRGGTGLGLSISYDIVQRHDGRINVESRPGKGTSFTLWLPTEDAKFNKIVP